MTEQLLLLDIEGYKKLQAKNRYEEFPKHIGVEVILISDFLDFNTLSLELKIYLTSMLIRRSVGVNGGIFLPGEPDWLVENFMNEFKIHFAESTRHEACAKAIKMIMSDNVFSDCIIGTTYMYTAIEFYLKRKLGFNTYPNSQEEIQKQEKFKSMSIGNAFLKVKKANFRVSKELHLIDNHFKENAILMGYSQNEFQSMLLQGRLNSKRNGYAHGHEQFWHAEGTLLTLLFILLHYCELSERCALEN